MMGNLSKKKFLMTMLILCAMQEGLYAAGSKEPENLKKASETNDMIKNESMIVGNGYTRLDDFESFIIRDEGTENGKFSNGAIQFTGNDGYLILASKRDNDPYGTYLGAVDISSVGHGINQNRNSSEPGEIGTAILAKNIEIKGGFDSNGNIVNKEANGIFVSSVWNEDVNSNIVQLWDTGPYVEENSKLHVEGANSAIVMRGPGIVEGHSEEITFVGHSEKNATVDILNNTNSREAIVSFSGKIINILSKNQGIKAGENSSVSLVGAVNINADSTGTNKSTGTQSIAMSAGTKGGENISDKESVININLTGDKESKSNINGDIIAGNKGIINIKAEDYTGKSYDGKLTINGDILAVNGGVNKGNTAALYGDKTGVVNLDLGKGGTLVGRADNYSNLELKGDEQSELLDKITSKGEVNIDLGENSTWVMTGESWVDNLAGNGTVVLANENKRGQKIHIENMTGVKTFALNLDYGNPEKSDMIYVGNVENEAAQILKVANEDELLGNFFKGEKIKFADVLGSKSEQTFGDKYVVQERGINDVNWDIEYVEVNKDKAVDSNRHEVYLANNAGNARPVEKLNDISLTMVEMAKANYASAVYMDNLNKRLGDMTFAEGNSGIWVRTRNDRVGEDNEYRLRNNMTQIGYDKTYNIENGKEYRGIAFDYADGQMEYKNIKGEADIDRYTATLYDTRIFDNGFYSDYTAKIGYMESEFDIRGRETGNQAKGDYDNLILGVGAEFGKRYNFGETSYFEPQVQLQYTYIDDTDYTTNQDTKVNYEEIHSLIGRAGIRVGHDFYKENSKDNTVYLKLDINHEFLGDQDIKAQDLTGTLNRTYHNDDTWYDVGVGGAKNLTEDLYVYADIERQFGHKDNSWQFNLGFRYKF